MMVSFCMAMMPMDFNADRPFYYAIVAERNPLFVGKFTKPVKQ